MNQIGQAIDSLLDSSKQAASQAAHLARGRCEAQERPDPPAVFQTTDRFPDTNSPGLALAQ